MDEKEEIKAIDQRIVRARKRLRISGGLVILIAGTGIALSLPQALQGDLVSSFEAFFNSLTIMFTMRTRI
jgi:hypothetical protein